MIRAVFFSPSALWGGGPGGLGLPQGLAFDSRGRLFVAEKSGNHRVQVFSLRAKALAPCGRVGWELDKTQRPRLWPGWNAIEFAEAGNHRVQVLRGSGEPGDCRLL